MIHYGNSNSEQKAFIENKIEREIYCNINDIVDGNQWDFDDLENYYSDICTNCGKSEEEECDCYEPTPQEVFEWYFVSEALADQLYAIGEPVVRTFSFKAVWGRTCSGQSIALDTTFWEIFQDVL